MQNFTQCDKHGAMNAKDLIQSLGGPTSVADEIGVLPSAVSNWSSRGVPWDKRAVLAEMAARKGIELPADFQKVPFWGASQAEGATP